MPKNQDEKTEDKEKNTKFRINQGGK